MFENAEFKSFYERNDIFHNFSSLETPKPEMMPRLLFPNLKEKASLEQDKFKKKLDEQCKVVRNKSRLIAQGYNQQGINFTKNYALVAS